MEMAGGRAGMSKTASLVCLHLGSSMGKLGLPALEGCRLQQCGWVHLSPEAQGF